MNPGGITEEVGSTARTFITAMKDHPAVLVLALCNLALIVFMYFALSAAATFRTELIKESFAYQKQAAELLARCSRNAAVSSGCRTSSRPPTCRCRGPGRRRPRRSNDRQHREPAEGRAGR